MDAEITKAIAEVMAAIPKLNKGEKNQHGNFMFASIDDFLEAVRPAMAKAGLVTTCDEQDFEVLGEGKDAWLKMRFAFVAHAGAAEYGPLHRTAMVRASMGSQALGAAQSYAEKQFLRSLFKMATGEGAGLDADSHPAADLPVNVPKKVSEAQLAGLRAIILNGGINEEAFCEHVKVKSVADILAADFQKAKAMLEKAAAARKPKDESNVPSEITGDDIPY